MIKKAVPGKEIPGTVGKDFPGNGKINTEFRVTLLSFASGILQLSDLSGLFEVHK